MNLFDGKGEPLLPLDASSDGQMDLFGFVPQEKQSAVKAQSPECSQNGLVHFKYSPLMKESIRCKGGFFVRAPGSAFARLYEGS